MSRLHLIYTLIRLNILTEMQYRANFWIQIVKSFASSAIAIGGLMIVYQHIDTLAGWEASELLALVGIFFIVHGLINTVIQPSLQLFMTDVHQGTLDFVILKPVNTQLLVSIRRHRIWASSDTLLGGCILLIALLQIGWAVGFWQTFTFGVTLISGVIIVYGFWLILSTCVFWFIRIDNIFTIFQSFYQAGRWPIGIYPQFLQLLLTFIIPIAFAITVPAEALTNRLTPLELLSVVGVAFLFFTVSRWFWNVGLRHYTGASA